LVHISHNRAKKGNAMLFILAALAVFAGAHAVRAALASLRSLPRSNEDWIWY
jgi:hypothetical protein